MKKFNISLHDITISNFKEVLEIIGLLQYYGINRYSLLIIPKYHNKEDIRDIKDKLMDISKGKEIILHGFFHLGKKERFINRLFTSGEGEVLSIDIDEFEKRVREGVKILNSVGLYPDGYIAPAWLIKKEHIKRLKKFGFKFTTTRYGIYDFQNGKYIITPVISFGCRKGIEELSINTFKIQLLSYAKLFNRIRIALHPCDIKNKTKIEIIKNTIIYLKKLGEEGFLSEFVGGNHNDKGRFTSSFSSIK